MSFFQSFSAYTLNSLSNTSIQRLTGSTSNSPSCFNNVAMRARANLNPLSRALCGRYKMSFSRQNEQPTSIKCILVITDTGISTSGLQLKGQSLYGYLIRLIYYKSESQDTIRRPRMDITVQIKPTCKTALHLKTDVYICYS